MKKIGVSFFIICTLHGVRCNHRDDEMIILALFMKKLQRAEILLGTWPTVSKELSSMPGLRTATAEGLRMFPNSTSQANVSPKAGAQILLHT